MNLKRKFLTLTASFLLALGGYGQCDTGFNLDVQLFGAPSYSFGTGANTINLLYNYGDLIPEGCGSTVSVGLDYVFTPLSGGPAVYTYSYTFTTSPSYVLPPPCFDTMGLDICQQYHLWYGSPTYGILTGDIPFNLPCGNYNIELKVSSVSITGLNNSPTSYISATNVNGSPNVAVISAPLSMGNIAVVSIGSGISASYTTVDDDCGQSNGSITVSGASGGTAPYLYALNGGTPQVGNVFSGLSTGNYVVTVQDANGCGVSTNVTVNAYEVTYCALTDLEICRDGCVTIGCPDPSGGCYSYEWYHYETGVIIVAGEPLDYEYAVVDGSTSELCVSPRGTETYYLNIIDNCTGCTGTFEQTVFVDWSCAVEPGNNGCCTGGGGADGMHFSEDTEVFVQSSDILVYPNPASENTTVVWNTDAENPVSISIYNSLGEIVLTKTIEEWNGKMEINLNTFEKGFYTIKLSNSIMRSMTTFVKN